MIKHLSYFLAKCLTVVATSALKQEKKQSLTTSKWQKSFPLKSSSAIRRRNPFGAIHVMEIQGAV